MANELLRKPRARRLMDLGVYLWIRGQRLVRRLATQKATPHQIALGGAIGAFIAFTPTFGVQMIIGFAAATAFKCSRFAAIVLTYISNPFTVVPVYMFTYSTGAWLLGQKPLHARMRHVLMRLESDGWSAGIRELFRFGSSVVIPLWVGGMAIGFIAALAAYPILLRLVEGHRQVAAQKREVRAQREGERLRMAAGLAASGDAASHDAAMPQELPHEPENPPSERNPTVDQDA